MRNLKLKSVAYLIVLLTLFSSCRKEDFGSNADQTTVQNGESEIGGEITLYEVSGDKITKVKDYDVRGEDLDFQNDRDKHYQIWDLVTKIVPLSHRNKMNKFLIYSGNSSQTAGFVDPTSNDLSTWRMGIAIDYAYEGGFNAKKELSYTIIHEFGHILTLNNEQVNSSIAENDCNGFFLQEGCAKNGSYLHTIYTRFWADIYPDYRDNHNEGQTRMGQFYNKYQDRFVTEYAATNLVEDFAEVFAFFVTMDNRPSGSTIADKKVLMLYEFPELVTLRDQIRSNGGTRSAGGESILPLPGAWGCVHKH
jgi:hypothetical protein